MTTTDLQPSVEELTRQNSPIQGGSRMAAETAAIAVEKLNSVVDCLWQVSEDVLPAGEAVAQLETAVAHAAEAASLALRRASEAAHAAAMCADPSRDPADLATIVGSISAFFARLPVGPSLVSHEVV